LEGIGLDECPFLLGGVGEHLFYYWLREIFEVSFVLPTLEEVILGGEDHEVVEEFVDYSVVFGTVEVDVSVGSDAEITVYATSTLSTHV
jgi:hypothetical protein